MPPSSQKRWALVADDHERSALACARALQDKGLLVQRGTRLEDVGKRQFSLVFADVGLPPSGAADFLRGLDASGCSRKARFVALVPPSGPSKAHGDAVALADAVLAKPFSKTDLQETASKLLETASPPHRFGETSAPREEAAPREDEPFPAGETEGLADLSFGGCRVERLLGRGGMGAVYLGRHELLETLVAIKLLPAALVQWDPDQLDRFMRGARAAAKVDHPNVAAVLHAGQQHAYYYLITRYAEGASLGDILDARAELEIAFALRVLRDTASALAAAHALGVVHRDVKPSNIIVSEAGVAKLTDFGLARADGDASVTSRSAIIGTPHYMSPEQCEGRPIDARSDIYSLGATLYHCLTGRPPAHGKDPIAVLRSHIEAEPPPARSLRPDTPAELNALVHEMLTRDPEKRRLAAARVAEQAAELLAVGGARG